MKRCGAVAILVLTGATVMEARQLAICLDIKAIVSEKTLKVFRDGMTALAPSLGSKITFDCGPANGSTPVYVLLSDRPAEANALGAALVVNGRVTPNIVLYCEAIRQYLPSDLDLFVGRAMARVLGHELIHYLKQSIDHDSHGTFAAYLHPARLMAAPSRAD